MSTQYCKVPGCKQPVNNQLAPPICWDHWRIMPRRKKERILSDQTAVEYKRAVAEGIRAISLIANNQPGKYPFYPKESK